MRGFRDRTPVGGVIALIDARVGALEAEVVALRDAAGRVLAEDACAVSPVPPFDRAAMDGFAVRGAETFGAGPYSPMIFRCVGEARPGRAPSAVAGPGQVIRIATGAPMPPGLDTVVKVENTQLAGSVVEVFEATPPGRHVGRAGEDVAAGTLVLGATRLLRPQDLGLLSAIGAGTVRVVRRPRVAILVTGDELLPPGEPAHGFQIADMNSVMLAALVARDGGVPDVIGPLADDRDRIRRVLADASASADAVLISGGSSTGPEDHAPSLVAELGRLETHGVAIRPASPTGLGFVGNVPVMLMPGNPVSCLCAYDFFGGRVVRALGGRPRGWSYARVELPLARKLVSVVGRVDYARVCIENGRVEPLAVSGASILSSTTRADGFVVVPTGLEGYPAGASVTVWLYSETRAEDTGLRSS